MPNRVRTKWRKRRAEETALSDHKIKTYVQKNGRRKTTKKLVKGISLFAITLTMLIVFASFASAEEVKMEVAQKA